MYQRLSKSYHSNSNNNTCVPLYSYLYSKSFIHQDQLLLLLTTSYVSVPSLCMATQEGGQRQSMLQWLPLKFNGGPTLHPGSCGRGSHRCGVCSWAVEAVKRAVHKGCRTPFCPEQVPKGAVLPLVAHLVLAPD